MKGPAGVRDLSEGPAGVRDLSEETSRCEGFERRDQQV